MYKIIKKILHKLLPKNQLFKIELFFRRIYAIFYFGKSVECNVCNSKFRKFINENNTKICPKCGSTSRNRHLFELINNLKLDKNSSILDFSPSRAIYRKFKSIYNQNYVASDFSGEFIADKNYDITNLDCDDNKVDLIICFHILEHIVDDRKAMKELFRVLKPNGICLIQTPFKDGEIYEDFSIILPSEKAKHFGQSDHVRIYSINGLISRLKEVGFEVEDKNYNYEFKNRNGFNTNNTILIAKKHTK